jgi:starch-binding outer membrane protein, SusD/RagB family
MNRHTFNHYTSYAGLILIILITGCSKGFINDIKPTTSASADQVFQSAASVRVYFNGIYRNMRAQWQSTDASAGGVTDVWGYNSVNLARSVKGTDVVMPYNSWYYFDYQNANREPTYRRVIFTWYFFYELINQVNNLIDGTQKSATIVDADKTALIAEARALRAYFYFELAREFQYTYAKDASAPGVPIYTTPTTDTTTGKPRGTLQQTYDQINADIAFAVANIGTSQLLTDQVNIDVAWGMAARIDLEQGMWPEAETAAKNALKNHSLDPGNYPNNWDNISSPEILWAFPQTTEDGGQSLYYGTPSAFYIQDGSGYDAFWMSADLVNRFSLTDIRNTFYVYDPDPTQADAYGTNKFGTAQGSSFQIPLLNGNVVALKTIDFNETLNLMRAGEMYLIEAEAKARQGESDADDVLFALQQNRDPNAVQSNNSGQALIDEILLERRKELYGEQGVDWLDAKRLQQSIDRTHSNHPNPNNYVIPSDDPRFNLKLPQSELQSNKSLTQSDQNQ